MVALWGGRGDRGHKQQKMYTQLVAATRAGLGSCLDPDPRQDSLPLTNKSSAAEIDFTHFSLAPGVSALNTVGAQ